MDRTDADNIDQARCVCRLKSDHWVTSFSYNVVMFKHSQCTELDSQIGASGAAGGWGCHFTQLLNAVPSSRLVRCESCGREYVWGCVTMVGLALHDSVPLMVKKNHSQLGILLCKGNPLKEHNPFYKQSVGDWWGSLMSVRVGQSLVVTETIGEWQKCNVNSSSLKIQA